MCLLIGFHLLFTSECNLSSAARHIDGKIVSTNHVFVHLLRVYALDA